jgi:hypothetical protein
MSTDAAEQAATGHRARLVGVAREDTMRRTRWRSVCPRTAFLKG